MDVLFIGSIDINQCTKEDLVIYETVNTHIVRNIKLI